MMLLFGSLQFLTLWILILVIFHKYTYQYLDLMYLTFISLIVGSYISFINPKMYVVNNKPDEEIVLKNFHRFVIVDLSVHLFCFVFIWYYYYDYYKHLNSMIPLVTSILVLIVYTLNIDVAKVYRLQFKELLYTTLLSTMLYFLHLL